MSCGCSNTTPITTTTNCGSCGYNCSNCTCPTNPIITPAVVCADPEPCSELFPLECVIYTGADIRCAGTADILYPAVLHYVVLGNSSTTARNFVSILNNINAQLCYLFSKDYISQFLTNIQNDATLKTLFCNIASSCNCLCTLTCPVVTSVSYTLNSPANDTVTGSFTRSVGGNTISFNGSITGNILSIISGPSVGTIQIGQQIFGTGVLPNTFITAAGVGSTWTVSVAYPQPISSVSMTATWIQYITSLYIYLNNQFYYSSSNALTTNNTFSLNIPSGYDNRNDLPWLVSVQAVDKIAEMLNNPTCTKGYFNNNPSIAVTPDNCGFGQTRPAINLTCPDTCIARCISQGVPNSRCWNYWFITMSGFLTFKFQQNVTNPTTTFTIQKYIIHWYKRISGTVPSNSTYEMQSQNDFFECLVSQSPYAPNAQFSAPTTIPAISQPEQWLVLKTAVIDPVGGCQSGFQVRRGGIYDGANDLNVECDWFIYNV